MAFKKNLPGCNATGGCGCGSCVPVADTFIRPNNPDISAGSPVPYTVMSGVAVLDSNTIKCTTNNTLIRCDSQTGASDVQFLNMYWNNATSGDEIIFGVRCDQSLTDYYFVKISVGTTGTKIAQIQMYHRSATGDTLLNTQNLNPNGISVLTSGFVQISIGHGRFWVTTNNAVIQAYIPTTATGGYVVFGCGSISSFIRFYINPSFAIQYGFYLVSGTDQDGNDCLAPGCYDRVIAPPFGHCDSVTFTDDFSTTQPGWQSTCGVGAVSIANGKLEITHTNSGFCYYRCIAPQPRRDNRTLDIRWTGYRGSACLPSDNRGPVAVLNAFFTPPLEWGCHTTLPNDLQGSSIQVTSTFSGGQLFYTFYILRGIGLPFRSDFVGASGDQFQLLFVKRPETAGIDLGWNMTLKQNGGVVVSLVVGEGSGFNSFPIANNPLQLILGDAGGGCVGSGSTVSFDDVSITMTN